MIVICAWCSRLKAPLDWRGWLFACNGHISHGICEACKPKLEDF
jgi:hypothetical protein